MTELRGDEKFRSVFYYHFNGHFQSESKSNVVKTSPALPIRAFPAVYKKSDIGTYIAFDKFQYQINK